MNPALILILVILGCILVLVGAFWQLVVMFQTGFWWGIATLLLPIVSLVFLFVHWPVARRPFFLQLAGFAVMILALLLAGHLPLPSH